MAPLNIFFGCALFCFLVFINNFFVFGDASLSLYSAATTGISVWFLTDLFYLVMVRFGRQEAEIMFSRKIMLTAGLLGALSIALTWDFPLNTVKEVSLAVFIGFLETISALFGFGIGMIIGFIFSNKK